MGTSGQDLKSARQSARRSNSVEAYILHLDPGETDQPERGVPRSAYLASISAHCARRRSEMRTLSIFFCNLFSVMPPIQLAYLYCCCGAFRIKLKPASPSVMSTAPSSQRHFSSRFTPIQCGSVSIFCSHDPTVAGRSFAPTSSLNDAAPTSLIISSDVVICRDTSAQLKFTILDHTAV